MKVLNCLAFLGLVGVVFGGGESTCGSIVTDFAELLQIAESKIERILNFITFIAIEYPGVTNSFIGLFSCNLNITNYILATALSQSSGADINHILDTFSGAVSPPFVSPLDCIEAELLSYSEFIQNTDLNVIPQIESLAQSSPVSPTSNCSSIIQYVTIYYQAVTSIVSTINDLYSIDLNEFSTVGQRDLFLDFVVDLQECKYQTLVDSIVELTNGDEILINAYLTNQTQSLPPPYNCIQGMIDDATNQVNESTNTFFNNSTNPK